MTFDRQTKPSSRNVTPLKLNLNARSRHSNIIAFPIQRLNYYELFTTPPPPLSKNKQKQKQNTKKQNKQKTNTFLPATCAIKQISSDARNRHSRDIAILRSALTRWFRDVVLVMQVSFYIGLRERESYIRHTGEK